MKYIILYLFLIINFPIFAQNQGIIYHGNKTYKSTHTWRFEINGYSWGKALNVTIGKDGNNGLIMVQTGVPDPSSYIGGNIYLFLSDGSRIVCVDRNIRDNVDDESIVLYKLTTEEIEKLKTNYITSLRFSIHPISIGGANGNKTATNDQSNENGERHFATDVEISKLFEE